MKNKNKKFGFTLIEILVVVGVTMLIMASIAGIMSVVFNSQNKNKSDDKISQNGQWVLNELKKNVLNAANDGSENQFICPVGVGASITITSVKDGDKTTISCEGNKIASISATGRTIYLLNNQDLKIGDCNTFVSCSTLPSLQLSGVSFNFSLENIGSSKNFLMDVTLRN